MSWLSSDDALKASAVHDRLLDLADMIGPVSHDLKNVLNNIVLQAASLGRVVPEAMREPVANIRALAVSAGQMLAELDQHRHRLVAPKNRIDLAAIIERTGRTCKAHGLQVDVTLAHPLPFVQGDESDCMRLLKLLIAAGHRRGTPVKVRAVATTEGVQVCVVDAGQPLPTERLDAFFDPFEAKAQGGSNLECAAASSIARRLDTTLEAANEPEGGVAVSFRLPIGEEADDPFSRS